MELTKPATGFSNFRKKIGPTKPSMVYGHPCRPPKENPKLPVTPLLINNAPTVAKWGTNKNRALNLGAFAKVVAENGRIGTKIARADAPTSANPGRSGTCARTKAGQSEFLTIANSEVTLKS